MKLTADIGGWVLSASKAATHVKGEYSPNRTFTTAVLGLLILGGSAMIAMFVYHAVINPHISPDYTTLGVGLGSLTGGGGLGAWFHSKSKEDGSA